MTWMPEPGRFTTTPELRAKGVSERRIAAAVKSGLLRRPRRGIYTAAATSHAECLAVAMKGRLTGLSAIEAMGGWCWDPSPIVHVAVLPQTSRVGHDPSVRLHWQWPTRITSDSTRSRVSIADALIRVALDESVENAVAAFDWALASGRVDRIEFEQILRELPKSARVIGKWVDPNSQSVLESVVRVRVRQRGWRVRSQARVGELGAIDLVVEDVVALESDGRQFHESTFESDRRKDLQITIEGRHSLRISTQMVREIWPEIEHAIAAALRLAGRDAGTGAAAAGRRVGSTGVIPPRPRGQRRTRAPHPG